jgi:hypothetical protein
MWEQKKGYSLLNKAEYLFKSLVGMRGFQIKGATPNHESAKTVHLGNPLSIGHFSISIASSFLVLCTISLPRGYGMRLFF